MILGIYGAGGLGRELFVLSHQINKKEHRWTDIIFIDDTKNITMVHGIQPIPFVEAQSRYSSTELEIVIAVGEPHTRSILRKKVQAAKFSLAILVHPSANISDDTILGAGTVVCYNSFVSCDVTIGENVLLQPTVSIGHDSKIGEDSVISTYVCIAGGCEIGSETYIGLQVPVKEGVCIGNQSIIGMGSVVVRNIPDQVIAIGNPARVIKENNELKVFKG